MKFRITSRTQKTTKRSNRFAAVVTLAIAITCGAAGSAAAQVKPGDTITRDNASRVAGLVSPGNLMLVEQGMTMKIIPTGQLDWPPPYKVATEQYSPQVMLTPDGELRNYMAGLPFPLVDASDPQAAVKIMWNFAFRPLYTDDVDARNVEIISHLPGSTEPLEQISIGHMGFYKYIGRTEVAPVPFNDEVLKTGIAYRAGAYPFLDPPEVRGAGIIRQGYAIPGFEDAVWEYGPKTRKLRRLSAVSLSDSVGFSQSAGDANSVGQAGVSTFASTVDPNSEFGFAAKIQDFNYRLLGEKPMLAVVEAENSPAKPCPIDGGRTICPEAWEMRNLYIIEATPKHRSLFGGRMIISKRIFYIDSEGWFITASDQFDLMGQLWKTIATFNAYRDRAVPDAKVAVWPFKRMFQTALVDEDLTNGFSTVVYSPGGKSGNEGWYINMGAVDSTFFTTNKMVQAGH